MAKKDAIQHPGNKEVEGKEIGKGPAANRQDRFGLSLLDQLSNEGPVHHRLIQRIEEQTNRNLIAYTSFFEHPMGIIVSHDAQLLEQLLQSIDLNKYRGTLDLLISSPGGSPTAAEQIVLTCREYCSNFRVIVADVAMSAATMVAMGADEIVMLPTAQLGPIDPQMIQRDSRGNVVMRAAKAYIGSYEELVGLAQTAIKNNEPPQPYLQLLQKTDPPFLQDCLKARSLAEQIAKDFLIKWMLKDKGEKHVHKTVQNFLKAGEEASHGRAIRPKKAMEFGLERISIIEKEADLWRLIWELQIRCTDYVQNRRLAKYATARSGGINVQAQKI